MYVLVALLITAALIALAWRGLGVAKQLDEERGHRREDEPQPPRPPQHRPRSAPRRVVAPDDDPEFLSEIDRRLREQRGNNN